MANNRKKSNPKTSFQMCGFNRLKDNRSYAEVAKQGQQQSHTHPPPPPPPPIPPHIVIHREQGMQSWLRKISLIGEATLLNHLGHLPKLLAINDDASIEINYVGGLKVLLMFNDSTTAKKFKDNKNRWEEHLKWVEWGDRMQLSFDKVAWIRIVGLPLQLWGRITLLQSQIEYGFTIAPYEDITHCLDLSCVKIGILTKRRTRINYKIFIAFEELIKLSITEFDEDCFPFKFDPSEDYYEKDV